MLLQQIVAGLVVLTVTGLVVWLRIGYRKEMRRRALLTPEQRAQLKYEDHLWSQTYDF